MHVWCVVCYRGSLVPRLSPTSHYLPRAQQEVALQRLKDELESQKEAQRACLEQQNQQALEQLREEMEAATQRERTFLSTEKEQALKQLQEQLEGERRGVSRCGGRAVGGGLHVDSKSQAGDAGRKRGVGVNLLGTSWSAVGILALGSQIGVPCASMPLSSPTWVQRVLAGLLGGN